jgi:anaerobic magnesium-protoporphyrin IX monomethyl ester cyclase
MKKKVLLGASHSVIEPLGLLHLSSIARQEGYEPQVRMFRSDDFSPIEEAVERFKPNFLGMTIYTGNHASVFEYLDRFQHQHPGIPIILGGPHATYFPNSCSEHADYVVLSEGFDAFRRILRDQASKGIVPLIEQEAFPLPEREPFYEEHPQFKKSPIKSVITQTGCPYSCTYCYNSSTLEGLRGDLTTEQFAQMEGALKPLGRLFPRSLRDVDSVIEEIGEIKRIAPETQMIYFQDDVFVGVGNEWMREFTKKFTPLGLSFHAQVRFEYANPKNPQARERLELMREAGCSGLTIAIESADPIIRKEVLNRVMKEDLMFDVLEYLSGMGYKVRTEQMLGLPCGATEKETKINLEADLQTLELNVRLREATGLPTMAWASIFAPYPGTKIGEYCDTHGFYNGQGDDVPEAFFERSVLKFPKQWCGPSLSQDKQEQWLSDTDQEEHKDKLQTLRDLFSIFALIPHGHKLAEDFLRNPDKSFFSLSTATRRHLYNHDLYGVE